MLLLTVALAGLATASSRLPRFAAASNATVKCPIIFDGRVPASATPTDFDAASGWNPFNPDYVKGQNTKWSEIVLLPDVGPSRFDAAGDSRALEVTISDKSIFQTQRGFRRAGLQFLKDSNNGSPAAKGARTLHWSVMQDSKRKLNLTHEYLMVWHEAADYSSNQFNFEIGTILGQTSLPKNNFKILNRQNKQIWSKAMEESGWQNFAITLDFDRK